MELVLHRIVYLFAVLIVTVGTLEQTRVASGYEYVEESCINLMPSQMMEANMSSQATEDAPFRASFVNNNEAVYTYRPNHEYHIVISSEKGDLFMGFIANMRLASDRSVIVGTVIGPQDNNTLVKTMTCNGANNTVTHMSITQHSSVEFIWIAPADLNETVILRFGVFKNLSLFWSDLHTPCIVPEGVNLFPSICNSTIEQSSTYVTSVGTSSPQVPSLSISSTAAISRSPSVVSTRSSSIIIMQSTFAPSLFSTQLNSNIIPTPSVSEVPHSSVINSEQLTRSTATKSIHLLSKVLTYTDTSINMPSSTPIVTDATLPGIAVTALDLRTLTTVTTSTQKNTLYTSTTNTRKTYSTVTTSAVVTSNVNANTLSVVATDKSDDNKLLKNTSEMMAIGIAVAFVLIICVIQIIIVIVGCIYRRIHNKSNSRSSSFKTLYSLDTASMRSESIRRSYRLNRDNQVDLKLNIIEVDECPSGNNNNSSSEPHDENNINHTCQPSNSDLVLEVDVHSTDP